MRASEVGVFSKNTSKNLWTDVERKCEDSARILFTEFANQGSAHVKNVTTIARGQLWCPQLIRSAKYPDMHTHSVLEDYTVDQHCSICTKNMGKRSVSTVDSPQKLCQKILSERM